MQRPGSTAATTTPLTQLACELGDLIGVSERFTHVAAAMLADGLAAVSATELQVELQAGFGEELLVAYYKALALLKPDEPTVGPITDLYLHLRLLCSLHDLIDQPAQDFLLRHGLDRELQESTALHGTARLSTGRAAEACGFGQDLAAYFGLAPRVRGTAPPGLTAADGTRAEPSLALHPWYGHLWSFQPQPGGPTPSRHAYLLVPASHLAIASAETLCQLVARLIPLLTSLADDPDALICAPLGTRKLSLSKPDERSTATYFDGARPVPFCLNRALEPYLLLRGTPLEGPHQLNHLALRFGPVIDSGSSLVYRDPQDYRLGDPAFWHQPVQLSGAPPGLARARPGGVRLGADSLPRCLVNGLLVQADHCWFDVSPCHQLADRYARIQGYSGHGPSGVLNQSVLITPEAQLSTWRYERNFDSWSGRSADVGRHPSLNFLAWQACPSDPDATAQPLRLRPLIHAGFPCECKVEDLRLFSHRGSINATAALILSRARYRDWCAEIAAEASAHNTIDDMVVVQALGRIDPHRGELAFSGLPVLDFTATTSAETPGLPGGFEKNWLIHCSERSNWLLYSVQPWRVFQTRSDLVGPWTALPARHLKLPPSLPQTLRNSAAPVPLGEPASAERLALVVHHRRSGTYIYDQYLMVLDAETLQPLRISRHPILSINQQALSSDGGFRKNDGVCYVTAALVLDGSLRLYCNLFDCRTCVLTVTMEDLIALIERDDAFASVSMI
jgi:hypothetical protein